MRLDVGLAGYVHQHDIDRYGGSEHWAFCGVYSFEHADHEFHLRLVQAISARQPATPGNDDRFFDGLWFPPGAFGARHPRSDAHSAPLPSLIPTSYAPPCSTPINDYFATTTL